MPKLIGESCELVKLCHINHIGPGFFETHCRIVLWIHGSPQAGARGAFVPPRKIQRLDSLQL